MQLVWFVIFLVLTHILVLQIFRLTTYHRYFLRALPLLVGYAVLAGLVMRWLRLDAFFLWWLPLESFWLFTVALRQNKKADAILDQLDDASAAAVRVTAGSVAKTRQFFAYSSFAYVAVVSVTYITTLNATI